MSDQPERLRTVFMGTPAFACPALTMLSNRDDIDLRLVVTQPDRPAGRNRRLAPPPVKAAAERLGLPVYGPESLRNAASRQPIIAADPELIVVAAFGLILGRTILELPRLGCLNLHASRLPVLRGANPVAMAIRERHETTGISLMRMERGLDTGPVYATLERDITTVNTTASLTASLGEDAAALLADSLDDLRAGRLVAVPQDDALATCTRPMTKNDGWIDWERSAADIEAHVRAMWPWPRAWTTLPGGSRLQVHQSAIDDLDDATAMRNAPPGTVIRTSGHLLVVTTGRGYLRLDTIQMPGRNPVPGHTLARHLLVSDEIRLGVDGDPVNPPLLLDC